jgi:hypothetical protein
LCDDHLKELNDNEKNNVATNQMTESVSVRKCMHEACNEERRKRELKLKTTAIIPLGRKIEREI